MTDAEYELEKNKPVSEEERQHYCKIMNEPLTDEERQVLIANGWEFANDDYIYIPDDYDGCMASGIPSIRSTLFHIQHRQLYIECRGNKRLLLHRLKLI